MEKLHEVLHQAEHHAGRMHPQPKRALTGKPDYGQDVPVFTLLFFLVGILFSGIAVVLFRWLGTDQPALAAVLSGISGSIGLLGLVGGSFLIWASRVGKYQMRDRLMAQQSWRGDEQVLDVGCGSGLLLIGAAKHLTSGKAVGVDIWDRNLEYGSTPENVRVNARIEGVADRIAVKDGNACDLPFDAGTFDLVFTSNMLHHLSGADRIQAIREMTRVLKPGGRLVIAEIAFFDQFVQILEQIGAREVKKNSLNMVLWKSVKAVK